MLSDDNGKNERAYTGFVFSWRLFKTHFLCCKGRCVQRIRDAEPRKVTIVSTEYYTVRHNITISKKYMVTDIYNG